MTALGLVIFGAVIAVAIICGAFIYARRDGLKESREEVRELKEDKRELEQQLTVARCGLLQIASGDAGNPTLSASLTIQEMHNPQLERR